MLRILNSGFISQIKINFQLIRKKKRIDLNTRKYGTSLQKKKYCYVPLPSNSQSHHLLQMIGHTLWTLRQGLSCQTNHIHRTPSLLLRWVKEDHSQKRSSRGWHFSNIDTTEFMRLLIALPTYQAADFPSPLTNQLSLRSLVLLILAAPQKWMKLPSSEEKKRNIKTIINSLQITANIKVHAINKQCFICESG